MQISQSSSVIVEMMVQVKIVNLPNNIQRLSCRSKEQTAANQRWSYEQSKNDGYRITVSKRGYQIYRMKKTWAKRLWLENTVISTTKLLSSIDGPIREPLAARFSLTFVSRPSRFADRRYLTRISHINIPEIVHSRIDSNNLPFQLSHSFKIYREALLRMSVNITPKERKILRWFKSTNLPLDSPPTDTKTSASSRWSQR